MGNQVRNTVSMYSPFGSLGGMATGPSAAALASSMLARCGCCCLTCAGCRHPRQCLFGNVLFALFGRFNKSYGIIFMRLAPRSHDTPLSTQPIVHAVKQRMKDSEVLEL